MSMGTWGSTQDVFLSQTHELLVQVEADIIQVLLPNLVQGLSKDASHDFQMATHMILAQLCSHAVLSEALLKGMHRNFCIQLIHRHDTNICTCYVHCNPLVSSSRFVKPLSWL